MRRYHERDTRTCKELPTIGYCQVLAVLDGQQRFMVLNIGLSGLCVIGTFPQAPFE